MKQFNSRDVAKLAGVSQTTVSLVLNNRTHISIAESTRERVRRAAHQLGYRPNKLAQSLVSGRTSTIGLLLPRLDSDFAGSIAQGVHERCLNANYRVLLTHSQHNPELEQRQITLLLDHQIDGLICVTGEWTLKAMPLWLDLLKNRGIPCVIVDDHTYSDQVDCVVSDDLQGARLVVEHLRQLGHERIVHLSGGTTTSTARDRRAGFLASLGLSKTQMTQPNDWVVGTSYHFDDAEKLLHQLLNRKNPPTALFAANDHKAGEMLRALRASPHPAAKKMALVGYANYEFADYLQLTSVDQGPVEMGRQAAIRLLARMTNSQLPQQKIILPTRLVVRQSSGAPLIKRRKRSWAPPFPLCSL